MRVVEMNTKNKKKDPIFKEVFTMLLNSLDMAWFIVFSKMVLSVFGKNKSHSDICFGGGGCPCGCCLVYHTSDGAWEGG